MALENNGTSGAQTVDVSGVNEWINSTQDWTTFYSGPLNGTATIPRAFNRTACGGVVVPEKKKPRPVPRRVLWE